ncbi:monooxygenase [Meredithblackwellia eburnea MCA 4105]
MSGPSVIIIGAGPSGISMAYNLKQKTGVTNFTIYDSAASPGGVWHLNTYPSCGCDVYSHLYSFSFNLESQWSQELADQPEIERYMNNTVDKLGIRPHIHTQVECAGAAWHNDKQHWVVRLKDLKTGLSFTRQCDVFISCVGAISIPKDINIPGHESFTGTIWHSARWNHDFKVAGKRIAVIGNGCSASQFVPRLVEAGANIVQYARSPQWYHPRPNHRYTSLEKFSFAWIPGVMRAYRLWLFLTTDSLLTTYLATGKAQNVRAKVEAESIAYMKATAPKKYHQILTPNYPLGCKRRVFDPGYLACLNAPNIELLPEGIDHIEGNTIVSSSGKRHEFDAIILATGYKVQEFLTPMEIVGDEGRSLGQYWKETRGAQAYRGTFVSHFPNFAIIFGPNSFPAHNSVIFTAEVQCEFTRKALIEPLVNGRAKTVSVSSSAENLDAQSVQIGLKKTVWEAGCSNWYLNEWGRNTASYPGYASSYWLETLFPKAQDFVFSGGSPWWRFNALLRAVGNKASIFAITTALIYGVKTGKLRLDTFAKLRSLVF